MCAVASAAQEETCCQNEIQSVSRTVLDVLLADHVALFHLQGKGGNVADGVDILQAGLKAAGGGTRSLSQPLSSRLDTPQRAAVAKGRTHLLSTLMPFSAISSLSLKSSV